MNYYKRNCGTIKEICELGCCVVHPGWCTAYLDLEDSIKEIKSAKQEMVDDLMEEVKYVTCSDK